MPSRQANLVQAAEGKRSALELVVCMLLYRSSRWESEIS